MFRSKGAPAQETNSLVRTELQNNVVAYLLHQKPSFPLNESRAYTSLKARCVLLTACADSPTSSQEN